MPLNIAAFRPNFGEKIVTAHPEIDQWVISGHSVGGAMAAQYVHAHSEDIAGLAIRASYPPDKADLSDLEIPVTSIYGSRATRITDSSVGERKHLLPADTVYVRIEGGDHHQFGSYEIDPEDHRATISRESQQQQLIQATLSLLESVSTMTTSAISTLRTAISIILMRRGLPPGILFFGITHHDSGCGPCENPLNFNLDSQRTGYVIPGLNCNH
jgi:hypothetical protein